MADSSTRKLAVTANAGQRRRKRSNGGSLLSKHLFGGCGEQLRVFLCCLCKCHREEFVDGLVGWLLRLVGSSASVVQLNNAFKVIYPKKIKKILSGLRRARHHIQTHQNIFIWINTCTDLTNSLTILSFSHAYVGQDYSIQKNVGKISLEQIDSVSSSDWRVLQ